MKQIITILVLLAITAKAHAKDFMGLDEVLNIAYQNNPAIKASKNQYHAEESMVTSKATLDDPMIGIANLDRNMETRYATITQKIRFPSKYFLQAKAQGSRAKSFRSKYELEKMKIRQKVATLYYSIYSVQNIIQLTKANIQAVQEFSRVAEKKYAAGKAPQSDSMKSHFELTQLELEIIRLDQDEEALQDMLKAVLYEQNFKPIKLISANLSVPPANISELKGKESEIVKILTDKSPIVKTEYHKLRQAEHESSLSKWEFAPDFQIQYQQRISGQPTDSRIYSVGMTVPLWFWNKGSKSSAASSKKVAQEYRLINTKQTLSAKVKDLVGKVEVGLKTLDVYKTSLIPQAEGAYNSSRGAYRANKTSFLDLLDSERSLYKVKTGFFNSLKQYVSHLTQLETQLGFTISNIDKNDEVKK